MFLEQEIYALKLNSGFYKGFSENWILFQNEKWSFSMIIDKYIDDSNMYMFFFEHFISYVSSPSLLLI
jgi:hypothetical protein